MTAGCATKADIPSYVALLPIDRISKPNFIISFTCLLASYSAFRRCGRFSCRDSRTQPAGMGVYRCLNFNAIFIFHAQKAPLICDHVSETVFCFFSLRFHVRMKATRPLLSYTPHLSLSLFSPLRRHLNLKHSLVYVNVRLSGFN